MARETTFQMEVVHPAIIHHLVQIGKMKEVDKWIVHGFDNTANLRNMEITIFVRRNKQDTFLFVTDFTNLVRKSRTSEDRKPG